jgi:hypothetical protein
VSDKTAVFKRLLLQSHPAKPGEPEVLQQALVLLYYKKGELHRK